MAERDLPIVSLFSGALGLDRGGRLSAPGLVVRPLVLQFTIVAESQYVGVD
jgi:hypothetical protein